MKIKAGLCKSQFYEDNAIHQFHIESKNYKIYTELLDAARNKEIVEIEKYNISGVITSIAISDIDLISFLIKEDIK